MNMKNLKQRVPQNLVLNITNKETFTSGKYRIREIRFILLEITECTGTILKIKHLKFSYIR